MLGLFGSLKTAVPLGKKVGSTRTEGPVALLHYRATTLLFLSCCIMVTSLEWIGNGSSIACALTGADDTWNIPKNVINTYCYIMSTFILPGAGPNGREGRPGVTAQPGVGQGRPEDEVHKAYYQWVSFMLFLQAGLFYFPHMIFKNWEGGKIGNIISGLHQVVLAKDDRQSREKLLARYLRDHLNSHNTWAVRLYLVQFLYLINTFLNIFLIDVFLQGEFSTYGMQVVQLMEDDPIDRIDPMSRIFPKVTKCTFRKFGPSGDIQIQDAICVLPINIINEKIYVVLWFWLLMLAVITLLSVLYNTFLLLTPSMRNMLLRGRAAHQHGITRALEDINTRTEFGDWMLLYMLAVNMEPMVWGELVLELQQILKDSNHNTESSAPPEPVRRMSHRTSRSSLARTFSVM